MKSSFIIAIKYQNKILQYESKRDELKLCEDNSINMKMMKERALKILVDDNWNIQEFLDVSKK